jgi:hypothetical protein
MVSFKGVTKMIKTLIDYGLSPSAAYAVAVPLLILLPILALRAFLSLIFGFFE